MSDFRASDFKKMLVNVHAAAAGTDMLKIPLYKNNKEFSEKVMGVNINTLLRYIPCMYDRESPFIRTIEDLRKRKYESALYAGFKLGDDNKFNPEVEKRVIRCQDKSVSGMIIRYCMLQRSVLFQEWIAVQEAYYKEQDRILSDSSYSNITKLREISGALREIQEQFLLEDKESALIEDFYGFYIKQTIDLRPEAIAKKLKDGEPLDVGEDDD